MTLRNLILSAAVLSFATGCAKKEPQAQSTPTEPGEPAAPAVEPSNVVEPTTPPPATTSSWIDRSADPAFALEKKGDMYSGRVADACPSGAAVRTEAELKREAKRAADTFDHDRSYSDRGFKLVGPKLELPLPYGGCPKWAGYTIVAGKGSPLPIYLCVDTAHDACEMDGFKVWSFDLTAALSANNATDVVYVAPTK